MRYVWSAIALCALAAVAYLSLGFRTSTIDAEKPNAPDINAQIQDVGPSSITLPVSITLDQIALLANRAPVTLNGEANDPIPGNEFNNDDLTWSVARGPIQARGANNAITLTTDLTGIIQIKGVLQLIRGGLGNLLGNLNPTRVPVSAQADLAANITATATPTLQSDWTFTPNLSASVNLTKAEVPVKPLGTISVRKFVQPRLDETVNSLISKVIRELATSDLLRRNVSTIWDDLCRAWPLGQDGVWLITVPETIRAAQPRIDETRLYLALNLVAKTSLVTAQEAPDVADCTALPPTLEFIDVPELGAVDISVPVQIEWDWLASTLNKATQEPINVRENTTLTLSNISLSNFGPRLLIGADMYLDNKGFFTPSMSGRIWVTAAPRIDRDKGILHLSDAQLTTESEQVLGRAAAWATDAIVSYWSGRNIDIDLAKLETEASATAQAQLDALVAQLSGIAQINARVDGIEINDLVPGETGLYALIGAKGAVAARDLTLPEEW